MVNVALFTGAYWVHRLSISFFPPPYSAFISVTSLEKIQIKDLRKWTKWNYKVGNTFQLSSLALSPHLLKPLPTPISPREMKFEIILEVKRKGFWRSWYNCCFLLETIVAVVSAILLNINLIAKLLKYFLGKWISSFNLTSSIDFKW